jgi:hypothetical protein
MILREGMPASPHQIAVLSNRSGATAQLSITRSE